jgi:hypothetical protein
MRRSQAGPPRKARVGSVSDDTSVYGVRDLAGGVAEWTSTPFAPGHQPALQVVRGGGYDDGADSCRCAARIPCSTEARPGVGFRLVRPLAPGGGDRISAAPIPSLPTELELPELAASEEADPVTSPMMPRGEIMARIGGMVSRLASGDAATLLPELLAEIVRLCHAERGLLLIGAEPAVIEARTGQGEPVPATDQSFDAPVARAALKQQRAILLEHPHPVLAIPLPCGERCLLLERRFHRSDPFSEDCLLAARAATEPLALALRLANR